MKRQPNEIQRYKTEYLEQGFDSLQATSLAWADYFEGWMNERSGQGNGFFSPSIRIDTYCADCKEGGQFLPTTVREFIHAHKGHKTRTIKLRS